MVLELTLEVMLEMTMVIATDNLSGLMLEISMKALMGLMLEIMSMESVMQSM